MAFEPPLDIAPSSQQMLAARIGAPPAHLPDWLDTFASFTAAHLVTVAILALAMAFSCGIGRTWKDGEPRFRAAWAFFIIGWQSWHVVWWLLPERWDLAESLPLHVCDLAAWIAALALLTQHRTLRTMLYFWGIGLSTQAFFTPVLSEGPGHLIFWFFWIGHTQIVGSAIYDVVVLAYRPSLKDLRTALLISVAYAAIIFIFDWAVGANYAYIGPSKPEQRTIIDALGPWPLRAIYIALIGTAAVVLAWAIWPLATMLNPRSSTDPSTSSEAAS